MGDWGFLSKLLDKVQSHSTSIGKVWLTVLLLFRIMVLGAGVEKVWGDEQSKMVCNTNSPGCRNVCYDAAFPISHTRFWVLQIVFVSSPTLVYLGYVLNIIHKEDKLRRKLAERGGGTKVPRYTNNRGKIRHTGSLLCIYIMCIVTTILLESAFIAGQYLLYGFVMYPILKCTADPCPSVGAECIISRPTEKTIIILFMLVVACVSVLLNIAEIFYLLGRASALRERSLETPQESDEDTVYNETHC